MNENKNCVIKVCPFAKGGEDLVWGLSPEGWAQAKVNHAQH